MTSTTAPAARRADEPEDDDIALAREAIGHLDFFRSERPGEPAIRRLGGLTNLVYRVDCNGDSYVLRVPGKGTDEYIDRRLEAVAAREAARVGVSPEVIFADAGTGVMVSVFQNATSMTSRLFKSMPGAPARAGEILKRLHQSGAKFEFRFDLFGMIEEYVTVLGSKRAQLPDGYQKLLADAEAMQDALTAKPRPLVACHCDPLPENFLDGGRRMWLVDWEYSGMNDPMWDLGDIFVEAGFDARQEAELIAAYFGGAPNPSERGRIYLYKALCDLLWTSWGLIQHANKNPSDDYWAYANRRFARASALTTAPDFAMHLKAVASG